MPANFCVYYACDDNLARHRLRSAEYGEGELCESGRWVLLEEQPAA